MSRLDCPKLIVPKNCPNSKKLGQFLLVWIIICIFAAELVNI